MKFIPENFVSYDEIATANEQGVAIEVRLCRSCPLFQPDGIQTEKPIIHGWCARLSDEELPHYIRVTTEDFCREDRIKDIQGKMTNGINDFYHTFPHFYAS